MYKGVRCIGICATEPRPWCADVWDHMHGHVQSWVSMGMFIQGVYSAYGLLGSLLCSIDAVTAIL